MEPRSGRSDDREQNRRDKSLVRNGGKKYVGNQKQTRIGLVSPDLKYTLQPVCVAFFVGYVDVKACARDLVFEDIVYLLNAE